VLLYFNVGKVILEKVNTGNWGDKKVRELVNFITSKKPELTGFNGRGLTPDNDYASDQFDSFKGWREWPPMSGR